MSSFDQLHFPLDVFRLVLAQCSLDARTRVGMTCKEGPALAWADVEEVEFDVTNVGGLCATFKRIATPKLRHVKLSECFFPVNLGVPAFMGQLTRFSWSIIDPDCLDGQTEEFLEWKHATIWASLLRPVDLVLMDKSSCFWKDTWDTYASDCLASLDPLKLEEVVLDNSKSTLRTIAKICEPFLLRCCAEPMPKLRRLVMKDILSDTAINELDDFALLERLRESWTMPRLEEFEIDCFWTRRFAEHNVEVRGSMMGNDDEYQTFTDYNICGCLRILGPVIRRIAPSSLKVVDFRNLTHFARTESLWRPRDATGAVDAVQKWFGQEYRKFCVDGIQCLCAAVAGFGPDSFIPGGELHEVAKCTRQSIHCVD